MISEKQYNDFKNENHVDENGISNIHSLLIQKLQEKVELLEEKVKVFEEKCSYYNQCKIK